MNKNQEELERIIIDLHISCVNCNCFLTGIQTEKIAQVILSAGYQKSEPQITYSIKEEPNGNGIYRITDVKIGGMNYVKLSDVELDEFKIAQILAKEEFCGIKCTHAAHAIAQARPIKVKQ